MENAKFQEIRNESDRNIKFSNICVNVEENCLLPVMNVEYFPCEKGR